MRHYYLVHGNLLGALFGIDLQTIMQVHPAQFSCRIVMFPLRPLMAAWSRA
jgi:hypothetical protein